MDRGGDRSRRLFGPVFLLVVLAATLAAAVLRLWQLGARELWLDEAYSAWFSAGSWHDLWVEQPRYEVHPPLYYSLLKLWTALAGDSAAALRFPSVVAGAVAVPVMALAARDLAQVSRTGRPFLLILVAVLLAALSSRLLLVGQEARPYSLLFLAYLAATWGWLRLAGDFRATGSEAVGRWTSWIVLGGGTLFVLWFHALGILYAAALFLALLAIMGRPGSAPGMRWRRLALTAIAVLLLYLPCIYLIAARAGDWSTGWLSWNPAAFPLAFLALFGLQPFGETLSSLVTLFLVPALCLIGIGWLWRTGKASTAAGLGFILLVPPLGAALASELGIPLFLPRTQIGILAPAYLLTALAVSILPRFSRLACLAILALAFLFNLALAVQRPAQEPWGRVAEHLREKMAPGDVVWVYPNDRVLPLRAAAGPDIPIEAVPAPFPALEASGRRIAGSPAVVAIDAEMARRWAMVHRPAPGATIWLVRQRHQLFDPEDRVAQALAAGRLPGARTKWLDIDLQPLRPLERRPGPDPARIEPEQD